MSSGRDPRHGDESERREQRADRDKREAEREERHLLVEERSVDSASSPLFVDDEGRGDLFGAVGSLMREVSKTNRELAEFKKVEFGGFKSEFSGFKDEVRQSFAQLGVRVKAKTGALDEVRKRMQKAESKVEELAEDIEDTKTRDLRSYKKRYNWWKNGAISLISVIVTGVIVLLIGHYIFKIG